MHCRLVRFIGTLVAALAISLAPESISAQVLVGNYPDLTGIWLADFTEYGGRFTREDPPLQPQALAVFNRNREGLSFGDTGLDPLDPLTFCYPVGALRQMLLRHFEIFQTPKEVLFIHEFDSAVRRIYLDGRAHPDGWPFGWMGHSVGHYDGDSLVVDTVGFNDKTWFDRAGTPHSTELHVVERFRRPSHETLAVDFRFEDPRTFTRPWTATRTYPLRTDLEVLEHVTCEDTLRIGRLSEPRPGGSGGFETEPRAQASGGFESEPRLPALSEVEWVKERPPNVEREYTLRSLRNPLPNRRGRHGRSAGWSLGYPRGSDKSPTASGS